jgi:hypothetical protein
VTPAADFAGAPKPERLPGADFHLYIGDLPCFFT